MLFVAVIVVVVGISVVVRICFFFVEFASTRAFYICMLVQHKAEPRSGSTGLASR